MKYLISVILMLLFISGSNAEDLADHCEIYNKQYNPVWTVDDDDKYFLDEKVDVINKSKFKDISFKKIWSDTSPYHYGLDISFDKRSTNLCFEFNTFPYSILIEEKEILNTITKQYENHLVFYIIVNVGKGRVYTVSFNLNKRTEKPLFWGLALNEIENHYQWFLDKLTLQEAIQFHKNKNYEEWIKLYWRGKWYHVEWYASDYK